jgi:ABC-type nitrate/sulfonate/bicarbonate transport system ATPase subunit
MQKIELPAVSVQHRSFSITVPPMTLEPGEILGIFGKSGSGKTTYMKRIRESFSPERVHYMSQYDCLLEESTIRQNIELGLACSAKPANSVMHWEKDYADLLQAFEVDRHLHKIPRQMSGGQRKRAEIVRCLMMDPEILLLDEPFQGIGHLFESVSTKYILERAQRKHGVTLIVSHDFDLLCRFSKKILLVDDKGIIELAPTSDPSWKPDNVRAAWTLGVENLLPAAVTGKADDRRMLAFWGRQARWGKASHSDLTLTIQRSDILSQRTFQRHGEAYTQVESTSSHSTKPLLFIAAGEAETSGDLALSVSEHWMIENNDK